MTGLLDEMVEARLAWISDAVRRWYDDDQLRAQLRTALASEAWRVGNVEFGREFRDDAGAMHVEDPRDWANRRLELASGGWAVTGIRFRGLDPDRPFVDVAATTEAPTASGLEPVVAAVEAAYAGFGPRCLRVDAPYADRLAGELRSDGRFGAASGVDQYVVAGLVADLRRPRSSASAGRLRLVAGEPEALAARAAEVYAELLALEPELAMWAHPEDAESLRECAAEGLLFEVLVDDLPAGVAAAVRDDDHGLRGFCVQELCLDADHRGRGFGSSTLEGLLDRLPAEPGDVLWGTIHPANAASLRNALAFGRELVGGYVWVVPTGFPGMPATAAR